MSIVERKTGFTLIGKAERKTAQAVSKAMTPLLKPYVSKVHPVTSDNGREFAGHEEIAATLKADFYFAHPYSSWERGTNENTNGLMRQYLPKGVNTAKLRQHDCNVIATKLNNPTAQTPRLQNTSRVLLQKLTDVAVQT